MPRDLTVSLTYLFGRFSIKMSKLTYVLPSLLPYSGSFALFTQYLGAIWNVVNFEEAEARFAEAT